MNPLYEYDQWKEESYPASVGEWEDWASRIVKSFRAELEAAKKDFDRIGQLGNTIDSQQVWVDKYKAERDEYNKAYSDECATNAGLQTDVDRYKKAWEDSVKYAHGLEIEIDAIRKATP